MDLFDLIEHPEVNGMSEDRPFNWDEFVAGKPAMSRTNEIAYYGGPCTHLMNTHLFIAIMTVPDHAVIKYGKETMPYVIDERGNFEGSEAKLLVKMA